MIQDLLTHLAAQGGEVAPRGHVLHYTRTLAERKTLLGTKKLVYKAQLRVDEQARTVIFSETLVEKGFGVDAGVGGKVEVVRTRGGPRSGRVEEQALLLGKKYSYQFDFASFRKGLAALVQAHGYHLEFSLTGS